jgi:hypothetical protein
VGDFQFLIVALRRLRRAAELAARVPCVQAYVADAIREFDKSLLGLRKMRNAGEHVDAYAVDDAKRHHREIDRRQLQVGSWDGKVFRWLEGELDTDSALDAAEKLYLALRDTVSQLHLK